MQRAFQVRGLRRPGARLCALLVAFAAVAGARVPAVAGSGGTPGLDTLRHWPAARLSGRRLIWEISYRYRIPVSAVLALPIYPTDIAAGEYTARAILDRFARANRNSSWRLSGAVAIVDDRRVVNDANNFLGKTARDVLMRIMNFSGDFSSVVLFRKSKGLTARTPWNRLKPGDGCRSTSLRLLPRPRCVASRCQGRAEWARGLK